MLINWGCEIAQQHGVSAFLEASPAGLPVYKKAGFQEVDRFVFDIEKYGGEGKMINVQMMKYPETPVKVASDVNIEQTSASRD